MARFGPARQMDHFETAGHADRFGPTDCAKGGPIWTYGLCERRTDLDLRTVRKEDRFGPTDCAKEGPIWTYGLCKRRTDLDLRTVQKEDRLGPTDCAKGAGLASLPGTERQVWINSFLFSYFFVCFAAEIFSFPSVMIMALAVRVPRRSGC